MTCDRTGLKTRVEDMRKEWTGAWVRKDWWESRHPQDFVKSRPREEGGPAKPSRPQSVPVFTGALSTVTSAAIAAGLINIPVESSARFEPGDTVAIMLDTNEVFRVLLGDVPSSVMLIIVTPLPFSVSAGALITDYSAIAQPSIG